MSTWQPYVDQSLVGTGDVDKAAIFDHTGTSVWASTPGWKIDAQKEMPVIVNSFKDNSQVLQNGFHVSGEKYITVKSDDRSLYGKKGKEGIVIVKTNQALIVTHHPDSVPSGNAAATVEKLADYLIGVGY